MKRTNIDLLSFSVDIYKRALNNNLQGYDPYDGLKIPILKFNGLKNIKLLNIAITQFFKNFPFNLRPFFQIKKERNSKALALFISGLSNIFRVTEKQKYLSAAENLADWLIDNSSPYTDFFAWGYNFPWQSRNSYKPELYPNIVTTSFVANALLELYCITSREKYLNAAVSAGNFMINSLNIFKDETGMCFSYSPDDRDFVYNANLLGSMILVRLWKNTGSDKLLNYSKKTVEFCMESQNDDGSWYYGRNSNQKWIDGFHTGYNLWALKEINEILDINGLKRCIDKGLNYYIKNLFDEGYIPRYYVNSKYPLDVHSFAVAVVVFCRFGREEEAFKVFDNAFKLLYSGNHYFYYRKYPFITNKIPYLRWSDSWMFYAVTELLKHEDMD